MRTARWITFPGQERLIAWFLLLFAVAFNLYYLYPEVAIKVPNLNDGVLHFLATERVVTALFLGQNPTDPWLGQIALGYPLFHYYQHLPYLPPAALHLLSLGRLPLLDLFNWTRYLLLSLFPLSIYWTMRRFGFGRLPAALSGLVAPLLATGGLYGLDFISYVWGGYGMYTQLWGMLLLPLALAQGYVTLRDGRGYLWATLLLAATLLSHLLFGYIALVSLVLFTFLPVLGQRGKGTTGISVQPSPGVEPLGGENDAKLGRSFGKHRLKPPLQNGNWQKAEPPDRLPTSDDVWRRAKRLILLLALVALVTAYFWVPFLLDNPYLNRSVWEEAGKVDSYGYEWALGALVRGELFDFGRWPSLTFLAGLGLALCLWRWRETRYRIPVALFILWLLLYFGRPTWGVLLDLLPLSRDLHLHRLIAGVHLGGITLMGLGLALPWQWALSRRPRTIYRSRRTTDFGELSRAVRRLLARTVVHAEQKKIPIVSSSGLQGNTRYLLVTAVLTALLLYPVYRERADYLAQNAGWMAESQIAFAAEAQDIEALTETLWQLPPGRVYVGRAANWGKEYKVGAVPVYALLNSAGLDMLGKLYHALSLNADIQVLFDESRPEHYNLFNVRYVVAPADRTFPDFVRPLQAFGRHRLYQVETSGYFDLVGSDLAFIGDKKDFYPAASRWLWSDRPRVKQHPTLFLSEATGDDQQLFPLSQAGAVMAQTSFLAEPARGVVIWERLESNAYLAQVEVQRESTLLLKVTFHPNWHATVDGIAAKTVMVMPSYVGVKVAPGAHHVRLEYRPRPLRGTLLIVGLLALPLVALAEWRRQELIRLARWLNLARLPVLVERQILKAASWRPYLLAREALMPHLPYLGGLALLTLLAGLPLFQFKVMSGHDALVYLPRAVEFYEGLRAGQLFPRWAPDLSAGYGQPLFNFNPPLFYYLSAFFHLLGFSFVAAQNLAIFTLLLLAGLGMYLLAGEAFGQRGGLVSAVAYLFAPYLLVTLYVRHALADFSAFAFIPLAFWGLYRFAQGGRFRYLLVGALSVALLLLSSNPVALVAFPAFWLFLGWLAYAGRSWRALLRGLWCLMLGLGLSAFFWLPALVERDFVQTSRLLEGYLSYRHHFVYLYQFFLSPWGYGLSLPGPMDEMSFAIGSVHLLLVGAALLLILRIRVAAGRASLLVSFFLIVLLLAAFLASNASQFLWERAPLLQFLQFPWRFLSLVAVSTAFVCGFPFLLLGPEDRRLANGSMGVLIVALFLIGFPRARPESFLEVRDVDYSPHTIAARDIAVTTAREYEPTWVRERPQTPAEERLTFLEGEGRLSVAWLSPVYYEFHVEITEAARLRVNTFYFPGWTLSVDGAERRVDYSNPQGLMEFPLERGEHQVQIHFGDTLVRRWGTRLSLLALFLLLLAPCVERITAWNRFSGSRTNC